VLIGVDASPALVENARAQHADGTYLCSDYAQLLATLGPVNTTELTVPC
jgi:hypothetical protein